MKKYILTCGDSSCFEHLHKQFLPSLVHSAKFGGNAKPDEKVIIVDYGFTERQKALLATKHTVVTTKRVPNQIIPVQRLRDFAMVAGKHCTPFDRIMAIDGGDVFFQAPLDELFNRNELIAATELRPKTLKECDCMLGWVPKSDKFGQQIIMDMAELPAVNGGMIYGPADKFEDYCNWAYDECTDGYFKDFDGADQWVLTWAAHKQLFPLSIYNNNKWNFTLCCVALGLIFRDGRIYDLAGQLVPVVHKDGGAYPDLKWKP